MTAAMGYEIQGQGQIKPLEHRRKSFKVVPRQGQSGHRGEVVVELLDDQLAHGGLAIQRYPNRYPHSTHLQGDTLSGTTLTHSPIRSTILDEDARFLVTDPGIPLDTQMHVLPRQREVGRSRHDS